MTFNNDSDIHAVAAALKSAASIERQALRAATFEANYGRFGSGSSVAALLEAARGRAAASALRAEFKQRKAAEFDAAIGSSADAAGTGLNGSSAHLASAERIRAEAAAFWAAEEALCGEFDIDEPLSASAQTTANKMEAEVDSELAASAKALRDAAAAEHRAERAATFETNYGRFCNGPSVTAALEAARGQTAAAAGLHAQHRQRMAAEFDAAIRADEAAAGAGLNGSSAHLASAEATRAKAAAFWASESALCGEFDVPVVVPSVSALTNTSANKMEVDPELEASAEALRDAEAAHRRSVRAATFEANYFGKSRSPLAAAPARAAWELRTSLCADRAAAFARAVAASNAAANYQQGAAHAAATEQTKAEAAAFWAAEVALCNEFAGDEDAAAHRAWVYANWAASPAAAAPQEQGSVRTTKYSTPDSVMFNSGDQREPTKKPSLADVPPQVSFEMVA